MKKNHFFDWYIILNCFVNQNFHINYPDMRILHILTQRGGNDSSRYFHLNLLTRLDSVVWGKELEEFRKLYLHECVYTNTIKFLFFWHYEYFSSSVFSWSKYSIASILKISTFLKKFSAINTLSRFHFSF